MRLIRHCARTERKSSSMSTRRLHTRWKPRSGVSHGTIRGLGIVGAGFENLYELCRCHENEWTPVDTVAKRMFAFGALICVSYQYCKMASYYVLLLLHGGHSRKSRVASNWTRDAGRREAEGLCNPRANDPIRSSVLWALLPARVTIMVIMLIYCYSALIVFHSHSDHNRHGVLCRSVFARIRGPVPCICVDQSRARGFAARCERDAELYGRPA